MTRQQKYQIKQLAEGNCEQCGKPRNLSIRHCDKCLVIDRKRARKRSGCKPWKPHSRGPVPLEIQNERRHYTSVMGLMYRDGIIAQKSK